MALDIKKHIKSLDRPVKRAVEITREQIIADAKTAKATEITTAKTQGIENTDSKISDLIEIFAEQEDDGQLYSVTFNGVDAQAAAAFSVITPQSPDTEPAAGDRIILVTAQVKASGAGAAIPALVATDASDGIVVGLLADSDVVKVKFGKDSGADYSANTYTAWVLPFVDLS